MAPTAQAKLLLTVDVEPTIVYGCPIPPEVLVQGEFDGEQWGVSRILDLLEQNGMVATFFVETLSAAVFGDGVLRPVCEAILDQGHDVQLHTHPGWITGRRCLHEHELAQQTEMIGRARDTLVGWIGAEPMAHRAGCFGADDRTIDALREVGIEVDMSYAPGYVDSRMADARLRHNRVVDLDGVTEIPMSTFAPLPKALAGFRLLDLDSCTVAEVRHFLRKAPALGMKSIVLLMHSFSLLDRDPRSGTVKPSPSKLRKFERIARLLGGPGVSRAVPVSQFCSAHENGPARQAEAAIPVSGFLRTYQRSLLLCCKSPRNLAFALVCTASIGAAAALALWLAGVLH